jgi:hypothetical protein
MAVLPALTTEDHTRLVKIATRGAYDLQALRIQCGLRLYANFRAKLKKDALEQPTDGETPEGELSDVAESIITKLRDSYRLLTEGVARNRSLPAAKGFEGDEVISSYTELCLVDNYFKLEQQEKTQFARLEASLEPIPIYAEWLVNQKGVGPTMAGIIVSLLDPHKAPYISSFWKYSGLDLGPDGRGRSRRAEHLVDRESTGRDGTVTQHKGITYNPLLKTKLMGVLATSFLRSGSPWRKPYDDYKHRLETDPNREKLTVEKWKKRRLAGEDVTHLWPPGRIHQAAQRFMIKAFLQELWLTWRKLEGLPLTPSYNEWKRGYGHGEAA